MALSDACLDFLDDVASAAERLAEAAHGYSAPGYPIPYGQEIDVVRRSADKVAKWPFDSDAVARLVHIALETARYHDSVPGTPERQAREEKLSELVDLLQRELSDQPKKEIQEIVSAVTTEGYFSERAAQKLGGLLRKLGKSSYDVAVKIVGDVGSAVVKKTLGL